MGLVRRWWRAIGGRRPSGPLRAEVERELSFHLEMLERENADTGMGEKEAARVARRRFGDHQAVLAEGLRLRAGTQRRAQRAGLLDVLAQDLRFGTRSLAQNPGFTTVATLTLAIGIGATTAVFSVIDAVLLRPLPYEDPERLVTLYEAVDPGEPFALAPANFFDWRERNRVFAGIAAIDRVAVNLGGGDAPVRVEVNRASADVFEILGIEAIHGRTFVREDGAIDAPQVAVLSHDLWRRAFGGDPAIIGATIRLDAQQHTVVGILPRSFSFTHRFLGASPDVWSNDLLAEMPRTNRRMHTLFAVARLLPAVTLEEARAHMEALAAALMIEYRDANPSWQGQGHGALVRPIHGDLVENVRPSLLMLLGAVGMVLLIACVNVANLSLARSRARRGEIAVRTALGAGPLRIARQLATESLLIGALGGAGGLLLAYWSVRALLALAPPPAATISAAPSRCWAGSRWMVGSSGWPR